MVAIDDSDALLQQDLGARLVTDLLQRGGLAGVGLAIVVSDINSIVSNADLMYELVSCENRQAYMHERELRARWPHSRARQAQNGNAT